MESHLRDKVASTGCCEPFDPAPWKEATRTWHNKIFVKDHVTSILHIPLNFGAKVVKNMELISAAKAEGEQLMLTDENSLWGSDIYIAVAKDVPGADMATISGTFMTDVFEGPYRMAGTWASAMRQRVAAAGKTLQKMYFSYTTCPRCAKAYGKNYVVLFAQIES